MIYTNWIPRDISRGKNTSKTGLYSSLLFATITLPLYIILVFEASSSLNQPLIPLLISVFLLPLEYLITLQTSVASGYAPQRTGYASFVMKAGQLTSGYLLIGFLTMGLTGAVIAIIIGKACSALIGLYLNWGILKKSQFSWQTLKIWMRSSWLHVISIIYALIFSLDVIVVRVFFGSEIPIAYYGLCMSITSIALFASVVSSTVYPRIISKKNLDDLRDSIWLVLFLSMPVFFLLFFFTEPIIALFGIKYLPMAPALKIFAFSAIIQALLGLITAAYVGLDRFDEGDLTAKSLYRSALFKLNIIVLIINCGYLLALLSVSLIGVQIEEFTVMWASIFVLCIIAQFIIFNYLIKRDFRVFFPFKILFRDIITFTIPAIPIALISSFWVIPLEISFYLMIQSLILPVATSIILYTAILLIISKKFRITVHSILCALTSRINRWHKAKNTI